MNFEETVAYLYKQLPMYQRQGKAAYKKDLTRTRDLLAYLGNPQTQFRSIHIAGTNGKGTCAHAIAATLQVAGYHTGLYTSPHLKRFTERIRTDGNEISEDFVVGFVERIRKVLDRIEPSFFEITVAMAFDYFAYAQVDVAVIETGLGGRLDSTNVIQPEACLITNIGWDHMDMLGDTLAKIACEKAGIIKRDTPIVIGEYQEEVFSVFKAKAAEVNAPLMVAAHAHIDKIPEDLPYHKKLNFRSVFTLCKVLNEKGWEIAKKDISEGIQNLEAYTGLKGRFQKLSDTPLTLADVSHNAEGLSHLFSAIQDLDESKAGVHIVYGTVKGRDLSTIWPLFPKNGVFYWTQAHTPRSLPAEEVQKAAASHNIPGDSYPDVNVALTEARKNAGSDGIIVVTGSTFVVADLEVL